EFRGEVTNVQDSTVEIKDEAGKTHSFDTTGLQNLEELQAEALQPGDLVRVEINGGQATLIEKVEAKSDASSEDSSTTAKSNTEKNDSMKQDVDVNKESGAASAEGNSEMAKDNPEDADSMKQDMNKENEPSAEDTSKDESSMSAERHEGTEQAEISGEGEYVVKEGDTLGNIAEEQLGSQEDWQIIARANDIDNPDKIYVGQRLTIPSDANNSSEEFNREEAPDSGQTEPMKDNTENAPTAPGSY
ncbi:MAG: LysM peptidoglycan-binding domain-containing protein, partial [Thermodesulfobacteriota bacterium]